MKPIEEMADIIELQAWAGNRSVTLSGLKEELESALDSDDKEEAAVKAQNLLDTFSSRKQLLGSAYPFETDGYRLEVSPGDPSHTTYIFCLALSLLPPSRIQHENRCIQFETVVMNAAKGFFGGEALRIGAPWATHDITEYGMLLDKVIDMIPDLGDKLQEVAPEGGDAGWDVLIVKNFSDNLFPRFVALGNCATGRTDWKRKGMETMPGLFWSYFQGQHRSTFITFFAVPYTMDRNARLRKYHETLITFDRFRICEHAPKTPHVETKHWLELQREAALEIALN